MNLLVVIIALVLRHRGLMREPAGTIGLLLRRWRDMWLQRGGREGWAPVLVVGLSVLLPALVLAVVLSLPDGLWQRLAAGLAGLLVLGLVLLDQRQPAAGERYRALWQSRSWPVDTGAQSDLLAAGLVADSEMAPARRDLIEESLRQLFAPLFWFLLLGPVGALAYYLLRLNAEPEEGAAAQLARRMLFLAEWPVARVLALTFALAGDFVSTWQHLQEQLLLRDVEAVDLLDESVSRAQPVSLAMAVDDPLPDTLGRGLQQVDALLQRSLILWVVLLSLHTLLWF